MPLLESPELTHDEMVKRAKRDRCQCGGNLTVAWSATGNCYALRCCENIEHSDFVRPHTIKNYDLPGYNMPGVIRRKEKEMMKVYGEEKTKQMVKVAGGNIIATLTQTGAAKMLTILYPEAAKNPSGQAAIIKGSLICRDYGLNPAMDHLFLIPFEHREKRNGQWVTIGTDWSVVRGIKASRLICGREKSYGYIENTPRIMTEAEQMEIYGEVDAANIVTICKLKDKDGNIFPGYGRWPKETEPKGVNKGNTKFNMSSIRAERQALDKLNPGAMPADVDVVDERFIEHPSKVVVSEVEPEAKQITEAFPDVAGESCDELPPDQAFEKLESAGTTVPPSNTPPEATAAPPLASDIVNGLSMEWLAQSMKTLGWKVATVAAWMRSKPAFAGLDVTGTKEMIIARMTQEQVQIFQKLIQEMVDLKH